MTITKYKNNESVLVVVFIKSSKEVLLLQRNDDATFWQSVSGSLEFNELPIEAAVREVYEELGLKIQSSSLIDCKKQLTFDIFEQFLYKFAPGVTQCLEHWFLLALDEKPNITLTEHSAYKWVDALAAQEITKSWNNALAIHDFVVNI